MSESGEQDQGWYVWTVRAGKFDVVKQYIESNIPEVTKVLYPTITTERATAKGEVRKKKSPLYAGYMFLRYTYDEKNPLVWIKLNNHPFVTGYVGPCTAKDLASVDSLQKVEKLNDEEVKNFKLGDSVRVCGGVFRDYAGEVVGTNSNSIAVELHSADKSLRVVFSPEDLLITDRR